MTWKRAAHYTWRAFLTFLVVSIPGLAIQIGFTDLLAAWQWGGGNSPVDATAIGIFSSVRALAAVWVQFSVLFVVFKYVPEAIAEVQEGRRVALAERAANYAAILEQ